RETIGLDLSCLKRAPKLPLSIDAVQLVFRLAEILKERWEIGRGIRPLLQLPAHYPPIRQSQFCGPPIPAFLAIRVPLGSDRFSIPADDPSQYHRQGPEGLFHRVKCR